MKGERRHSSAWNFQVFVFLLVVLQFHVVKYSFMCTLPMMVSRLMILMSTCVLTFCSFNEISTVGCGWRLRRMRRHSHVLIATPHVSDQSLLLVAHRGERLSCFGRRSSSASRCGDAFWLLVSRPTASQCSRPFRFHFWRWSLCLSVLLAKFSDDHTVLRRRR